MTSDLTVGSLDTGKVVQMQGFRSGKSLSPIRQVEAYWTALREGGSIPRRTQIDPRGLENILEYAFVLERIAPGIARFRLAGQHLTRVTGMEVRGIPISALFTPGSRAEMGGALENTFGKPAVTEFTLTSERRLGRPAWPAQMIVLPLKSDLGDISRALGVLVCDDQLVQVNGAVRFEISNVVSRRVQGLTYPLPEEAREPARPVVQAEADIDDLPRSSPLETTRGFAEARPVLGGKVPYLRLVKSDS